MVPSKCSECKKYKPLANDNYGVCSAVDNYFPVGADDRCHCLPNLPSHCEDCFRFNNDEACFTVRASDSIYRDGQLCIGFINKHDEQLVSELMYLYLINNGNKSKVWADLKLLMDEMHMPWED